MSGANEFSVWWDDPEGMHHCEGRAMGAKEAVELAKSFTERPAVAMGIIRRVIITDGGDNTVFEWLADKGVTFPPRDAVPSQPHAEH